MHSCASLRVLPLLLAFSITLLAVAQDGHARIGETREECIRRYGKPVYEGPGNDSGLLEVVWQKSGLRVSAWFEAKQRPCKKISFGNADSSELAADEIQRLLKENSSEAWIMVCDSGDTTQWVTRDFTLRAYYHKTELVLTIEVESP